MDFIFTDAPTAPGTCTSGQHVRRMLEHTPINGTRDCEVYEAVLAIVLFFVAVAIPCMGLWLCSACANEGVGCCPDTENGLEHQRLELEKKIRSVERRSERLAARREREELDSEG